MSTLSSRDCLHVDRMGGMGAQVRTQGSSNYPCDRQPDTTVCIAIPDESTRGLRL